MKYKDGQEVDCGDVVRLRHGGPKMTVSIVGIENCPVEAVSCKWFDTDNILHEEEFFVRELKVQCGTDV